MIRSILALLALGLACATAAAGGSAPPPPDPADWVATVEPASTRAALARVDFTVEALRWAEDRFSAPYTVRVVPFFFFNERGTIRIDFDRDAFARLRDGEAISFTGTATNHRDTEHRVTGEVVPEADERGTVHLSIRAHGVSLSFTTPYRLTPRQD
ncbi:MAG: hypothetical protein EA425_18275 [Puniceicoccaceae bacterium]|nr:MAG: hypothetical protein EA425_18275 [Puniceicoccaceae bacterium]